MQIMSNPDAAEQPVVDWSVDPAHPKNFARWRKWVMVVIVSFSSLCITCTSAIYSSTYEQTMVEFDVSELAATVGLSVFILEMGIDWAYVWGLTSAAFQSVAGGTISDLFTRQNLQLPMMVYTATPFAGPVLGPMIGGFMNYNTSWRWTFYVIIIWSASLWVLCIIFLKETYAPVLLRRRASENSPGTPDSMKGALLKSLYRPFLLLSLEPMILCLCLYTAVMIGTLYLFFGAFPLVFAHTFGFNLWQIGLTFLGQLVGTMIGALFDPLWWWNLNRLVRNYQHETGDESGDFPPEFRLPPAILGAPLPTIGMFWFGWSSYPDVHWIMPIIGSAFFGLGVFLAFQGIFTFLVDAYPLYAASALAANAFLRSVFAAAFPLFGVQMYNALGYQWATSLLAFLTVAMLPFPYIFFQFGPRIRAKSRFTADPAVKG
ncbi:major facilitator superfamily domain-containing protein [Aspergillus crustosus]